MKLLKYIIRFLYCKMHNINKAEYTLLTGGGKLGENCEIYSSVVFGSEPYLIEIGNNVRITDGVKFVTHDGGLWTLRNLYDDMKNADCFGRIVVKDNVHIGWNTVIMPGVTIGNNVVIGASSIVTKSIPSNVVVAGNPAKIIKSYDEYITGSLPFNLHCKGMRYNEKKKFLLSLDESKFIKK